MTKKELHNLSKVVQLTLITLLLASSFVVGRSIFSGIITAKGLWVQAVAITIIIFVLVCGVGVRKLYISLIDVLVFALMVCMLLRDGFGCLSHVNVSAYVLRIIMFYSLYVFFRLFGNDKRVTQAIIVIYLLAVVVQAVIGLLQLYGLLESYHALFKITGTFHNPGPFSGFVVSGLPIALALYLGSRNTRQTVYNDQSSVINDQCSVISKQFWASLNWDRLLNCFAQVVIVILLLILPAARSRAAWLGGIIGCLYVAWQFGVYHKVAQRFTKNHKVHLSGSLRKIFVPFVILIFTVTLLGLYKFKQGSADGRLLIWRVSWEMIKDKPLLGWGQGGFEANYANYQAEWFRSGKGTEAQEMVAGSPDAPFNELIRVAISYGLVGVVLVFALLIILFRKEPQRTTEVYGETLRSSVLSLRFSVILKGGLVSILVFSLFSYPLDVTPILVQLILLAAILVNHSSDHRFPARLNQRWRGVTSFQLITKITTSILLIAIISFTAINLKNNYAGLTHWQKANKLYKYELYSDASEEFELARQYLPKNGLLLQMQAKCYTMVEKWNDAIRTASLAQNYTSGQILNIVLGDAHKALGDFKKSESAYQHASAIIPHKFFPKYLLAKMYDESGQKDKAVKLANELLNKEIKVESTAINEMQDKLINIINQREKEQEATLSQNVALPVRPPLLKEERR